MRTIYALALAVGFAGAAQAAETGVNLGKHNTNAPINVSADRFDADQNSKSGTYSGNVIVTQGDMHIRANTMRINVVGNKPDKIVANGNVVFTSATSGTATGDNAVYDVGPRFVTFTGKVVLTKDKNVMRGNNLRINLVTGKASLTAVGSTTSGGRVQAIFSAPPQSTSNPGSTSP
ncbi:MAG TPA: lipopolysaccharide transport periplasmic protein LptA [Rhizomicrobium sp.]|jgi:lipopolysaccharide export system protein LptA|nr:lipopolysaccharide transport periplasmic protein LptA [Rhizomicrobium sp.]